MAIVDVVVRFIGGTITSPLTESEVFPNSRLSAYLAKSGRTLKRIGQTTNKVSPDNVSIIVDAGNKVMDAFAGQEKGVLIIFGSSSGGRCAIDLAVNQSNLFPVRFLATIDAAWFPQDATNFPDNLVGDPTNIPEFAPVSVKRAEGGEFMDFFQTVGNHSKITTRGRMFTSKMKFEEIHGSVSGFHRVDVSSSVKDEGVSDEVAHINGVSVANGQVFQKIQRILESL